MNANCVDAVRALVNRCTPINITAELECLWHVEPLLTMQCVCVCVCVCICKHSMCAYDDTCAANAHDACGRDCALLHGELLLV